MAEDVQVHTIENGARRKADISFGTASRFFCVVGGLFAIGGGFSLIDLRAASDNNLFEAIAHGIGWYCIGKGFFMIAVTFQAKGAVLQLLRR